MRLSWVITNWAYRHLMRRRHYGAFAAVRALTRTLRVVRALLTVPLAETIAVPVLWILGEGWHGAKLWPSIRGILSDWGVDTVRCFWVELVLWMKWRWPGRVFPLLGGDAQAVPELLREQFGRTRARREVGP
jgi:hypothetical protein